MSKDRTSHVYLAAQAEVTANTKHKLRELAETQLMEGLRRGLGAILNEENRQATDPSRRYKMLLTQDDVYGIGFAVYFEDEAPSVGFEKARPANKYSEAPFLPPLLDLRVKQDEEKLSVVRLSYAQGKNRPVSFETLATVLHGSAPILSEQAQEAILSAIQCAISADKCSDRLARQQSVTRLRQHEKMQKLD